MPDLGDEQVQYAFVDILPLPSEKDPNRDSRGMFLREVREINMGNGVKVFRGDRQGIWLGAATYEDAPFKVSMLGAVIASALTILGGIITGAIIQTAASGGRVVIDGNTTNKRFYTVDDNGNEIVTIYATGSVHGLLVNKASNSNIENCIRIQDVKNENDNGSDNGLMLLTYSPTATSSKPLLRLKANGANFTGQFIVINGLGTHTGVGQQMVDITAGSNDDRVIVIGSFATWNVRGDGRQTVSWLGVGATAATASAGIQIDDVTKALLLSRLTTTERDALTPTNGMLIYNTTLGKFQGYEAGAWANLI